MKINLKNFWTKYNIIFKDKYFLTILIFFIWIIFFDQNNLLERRKQIKQLNKLKEEKEYYLQRIENDKRRLKELKTDSEDLEKFAREEYLMKKENEDIYLIIEK
jgi:cell division protein FtsB